MRINLIYVWIFLFSFIITAAVPAVLFLSTWKEAAESQPTLAKLDEKNRETAESLASTVNHRLKLRRDYDRLEVLFHMYNVERTGDYYEDWQTLLNVYTEKKYILRHTPSAKPTLGPMVSGYGYRADPFTGEIVFHRGADFATPSGTPIMAPADGVVVYAGIRQGYGMVLFIKHANMYETRYGHCSRLFVSEDDVVTRGQLIAEVGNTGRSTGSHLHYEIKIPQGNRSVFIDPMTIVYDLDYMAE